MKINAKKTNSTSENTIQSSYFVLELRKLFFFKEVNLEIEIFHPRNPFESCCGQILGTKQIQLNVNLYFNVITRLVWIQHLFEDN